MRGGLTCALAKNQSSVSLSACMGWSASYQPEHNCALSLRTAAPQGIAQHVQQRPELLPQLLTTLFEIVLFEECNNQWSLSRPMLSLILVNEQIYNELKHRVIASQPVRPLLTLVLTLLPRGCLFCWLTCLTRLSSRGSVFHALQQGREASVTAASQCYASLCHAD